MLIQYLYGWLLQWDKMIIDVEAWGALKDNTTTKVNKLISLWNVNLLGPFLVCKGY